MSTVFDLTPEDAEELTVLYRDYEWWADRDVETVREALAETDVAVGVESNGVLVVTARILTDYAYYANVFDVLRTASRF